MAGNEINIKISTKTDTAPLEELSDMLEDIQDNADIKVEVEDGSIDDATEKTEELQEGLDEVDDTSANPEVEAEGADDVMDKFDELLDKMDEISDKIVSPQVDTSGLDEANEKLEETDSTISNLITTMAGLIAAKEIEEMATIADNINNSWNRVSLTFSGTQTTIDVLKEKVSELSAETGRSGGLIRDYFNEMGIAGVTNADILASSFESISGFAYQSGDSIESMEGKLQRLVMTGNVSDRMLMSLGITAEELAASMGVSADEIKDAFENMTPEERLQAISQAMGDGAAANQMYGDSYEGMKAKAEMAMSGLKGAVGQSILPVLIPALDTSTQMINGMKTAFQNLPGPVQSAIGTIAGVGSITVTAIGVLGEFGSSIQGISDGISSLRKIKAIDNAITKVSTALQWAWNAALTANPIGILIVAIAALIAILAYLYFNNEQVREAIDNLGASFVAVGQMIWGAITDVYEQAVAYYENFCMMMGELQTFLVDCVNNFVATLMGFGEYLVQLGQQIYMTVVNAGMQIIQAALAVLLWWATLPIQIATILSSIISKVVSFASNFVSKFVSAGTQAVSRFISYISQIPGKLAAELGNALNKVNEWAATLPPKFWQAGVDAVKNFLNALGINSPGTMQRMLVWEVSEMGERVPEEAKGVIRNVSKMGSDIVDAFGNPVLDTTFANDQVVGYTGSVSTGNVPGGDTIINVYGDVDSEKRVQEIVDAVRHELNWDNKTAGRSV